MNRILISCLAIGLCCPLTVAAQDFTGTIVGIVTDTSALPIPGATVTLASPAIQGVRSAVTDADGGYRYQTLPPGTYSLTFELPGFATLVREGVLVSIGRTVTINVQMTPAAIQETVTVSGATPVVDVQSAQLGVNFDRTLLENIPNSRDVWGVMATTPGIQMTRFDVGGSSMGTNTAYRAYGLQGQIDIRMDGIPLQSDTGGTNLYLDYGALSELRVSAAGNSAELSVPGASVNATVKTGSNELHGTFYTDYEGESFQSDNITDQHRDGGIVAGDKFHRYNDLNFNVGGPFQRDKFWWFYSFRRHYSALTTEMRQNDGTPGGLFTTTLTNHTAKVNYQLSKSNSVFATVQTGRKAQPYRGGQGPTAAFFKAESTGNQDSIVYAYKGQYNAVLGSRGLLEFAWNGQPWDAPYRSHVDVTPVRDLATSEVSGGHSGTAPGLTTTTPRYDDANVWQTHATASYFLRSHNLKTAFGLNRNVARSRLDGVPGSPGTVGHVVLYTTNGVPDRFQTQNTPFKYDSRMFQQYFYLQDNWQVATKLVLNVGFRIDRYVSSYPTQGNDGTGPFAVATTIQGRRLPVFTNIVPRLALIYDVFGDGKTAFKANYGRFSENVGNELARLANPNQTPLTNRYAWDGTLPITPALVARSTLLQTTGQTTPIDINPNLSNSYTDQYLLGLDHELLPAFGLNVTWVRTLRENIRGTINTAEPASAFAPVQARDPGPDGLVGTGDDRPFVVYERTGPAGSQLFLTNFDDGDRYDSFEVSANKRFGGGSQIITGFDYTKRDLAAPISNDPNQRLYGATSGASTAQWTYKVLGTYNLPWSASVSGSYVAQKGEPYGRRVQFTSALLVNRTTPLSQGNVTVFAEPSGAYYQDTIHLANIRLEKSFRFTGLSASHRLSAMFDLYNIGNIGAVVAVDDLVGRVRDRNGVDVARFGRYTQMINPRIFKLGVRYEF